jgi:L-asparaginase/Glu-tRNA(Gln) amidotransferase subunit D
MSIEKVTFVDKIEALMESGVIQVRTVTRVTEDGVVLAEKFHRHTVSPGQDYSAEDAKVKAICAVTHTAEVIAAYQAMQQGAAA